MKATDNIMIRVTPDRKEQIKDRASKLENTNGTKMSISEYLLFLVDTDIKSNKLNKLNIIMKYLNNEWADTNNDLSNTSSIELSNHLETKMEILDNMMKEVNNNIINTEKYENN